MKCWVCGTSQNLECHHIFSGCRRKTSEQYGLKVFLCHEHHTGNAGVHFNLSLMESLHCFGQIKFEKENPDLSFLKTLNKNYL